MKCSLRTPVWGWRVVIIVVVDGLFFIKTGCGIVSHAKHPVFGKCPENPAYGHHD